MLKKLLLIFSLIIILYPYNTSAKSTWDYPRLGNYFLDSHLYTEEAELLAKWDLLILGPEAQDFNPGVISTLRQLNPDIIILAYVSATGVLDRPANPDFPSLAGLGIDKIPPEWRLQNSSGNHIGYWAGARMINVTDLAKPHNNQKWYDWWPEYVNENIYQTGLWDGIFVDEVFDNIAWLNNGDIDLNGDGLKDTKEDLNNAWLIGIRTLIKNLRTRLGPEAIITINGSSLHHLQTNGRMLESAFADYSVWTQEMNAYALSKTANFNPNITIINFNTANTGYRSEEHILFSYTSALLGDGFYSFDFGDQQHMNVWWLDEYNLNLGKSLGTAYNLLEPDNPSNKPGLWRRDFSNATVLVNSTASQVEYDITKNNQIKSGLLNPFSGLIITYEKFLPADNRQEIIQETNDLKLNNITRQNNNDKNLDNISGTAENQTEKVNQNEEDISEMKINVKNITEIRKIDNTQENSLNKVIHRNSFFSILISNISQTFLFIKLIINNLLSLVS